jgi:hypothetical protein
VAKTYGAWMSQASVPAYAGRSFFASIPVLAARMAIPPVMNGILVALM